MQSCDEKLEPIKKDMATNADIDEISEDMAGFFHKTWEKMDETNERVTTIEDQLDFPTRKKTNPTSRKNWCVFLPSYAEHFLLCAVSRFELVFD